MHQINWHNQILIARGDHTLYWPAYQLLCAADVHLGKAATFQNHGLAVPSGNDQQDLARLSRALHETQAKTLLFLGDLVHHTITDDLIQQFADWRNQHAVDFMLVRGNHDRHLPELPLAWRTLDCDVFQQAPFWFCHEPTPLANKPVIAGHLHPVCRMRGGGDHLRLPCFHIQRNLLVLPAFSSFAGGMQIEAADDDCVILVAEGQTHALD